MKTVPLIGIARHRLSIDGEGVTTLVAFHGCPLHCKYCLIAAKQVYPAIPSALRTGMENYRRDLSQCSDAKYRRTYHSH